MAHHFLLFKKLEKGIGAAVLHFNWVSRNTAIEPRELPNYAGTDTR
jgi:hypothetical protein